MTIYTKLQGVIVKLALPAIAICVPGQYTTGLDSTTKITVLIGKPVNIYKHKIQQEKKKTEGRKVFKSCRILLMDPLIY